MAKGVLLGGKTSVKAAATDELLSNIHHLVEYGSASTDELEKLVGKPISSRVRGGELRLTTDRGYVICVVVVVDQKR